jgi:hypothetical protein
LTPVSSGREWAPQCACACSIPPPPESSIKSSSPTTAATTDSCSSIRSSPVVQNRVVVQFLGPCYTSFRDTPSIPRPHLQSFFCFPSVVGWFVKMWYETPQTQPRLHSGCCPKERQGEVLYQVY